jgi:hypothetical protein
MNPQGATDDPIVSAWRREHGPEIEAGVDVFQDALYTWYRAWVVRLEEHPLELPRRFTNLQSAQSAADHFVRTTFAHRCADSLACGMWTQSDATRMK